MHMAVDGHPLILPYSIFLQTFVLHLCGVIRFNLLIFYWVLFFVSIAVNGPHVKISEFGGLDPGDDSAALLAGSRKLFSQFAHDDTVREFDFRQYLFSRQAEVFTMCSSPCICGQYQLWVDTHIGILGGQLLFNLQRPAEVSGRGHSFIIAFAKILTQHEVHVIVFRRKFGHCVEL